MPLCQALERGPYEVACHYTIERRQDLYHFLCCGQGNAELGVVSDWDGSILLEAVLHNVLVADVVDIILSGSQIVRNCDEVAFRKSRLQRSNLSRLMSCVMFPFFGRRIELICAWNFRLERSSCAFCRQSSAQHSCCVCLIICAHDMRNTKAMTPCWHVIKRMKPTITFSSSLV